MATMLTVARRIAQMHKTRRGLAMMGFDFWAGKAFWRGLRFTCQRLAVPEQTCFRRGKEPVLDMYVPYLLLFFTA